MKPLVLSPDVLAVASKRTFAARFVQCGSFSGLMADVQTARAGGDGTAPWFYARGDAFAVLATPIGQRGLFSLCLKSDVARVTLSVRAAQDEGALPSFVDGKGSLGTVEAAEALMDAIGAAFAPGRPHPAFRPADGVLAARF